MPKREPVIRDVAEWVTVAKAVIGSVCLVYNPEDGKNYLDEEKLDICLNSLKLLSYSYYSLLTEDLKKPKNERKVPVYKYDNGFDVERARESYKELAKGVEEAQLNTIILKKRMEENGE